MAPREDADNICQASQQATAAHIHSRKLTVVLCRQIVVGVLVVQIFRTTPCLIKIESITAGSPKPQDIVTSFFDSLPAGKHSPGILPGV